MRVGPFEEKTYSYREGEVITAYIFSQSCSAVYNLFEIDGIISLTQSISIGYLYCGESV